MNCFSKVSAASVGMGLLLLSVTVTHGAVASGNYGAQPGRLEHTAAPGWSVKVRLGDGTFQEFKSTSSEPSLQERNDEAVLVWKQRDDSAAQELTIRLTRAPRKFGTAWRMDVNAGADTALWEVTFPDFATVAYPDDLVLLPTVSGRLHPASERLDYKSQDRVHYPSGLVTMQCAGLYGSQGGVYIGVHDPVASNKKLEIQCADGRFGLRWRWPVPDMGVAGNSWTMPGEVLIRSFAGDWFDIAQIYRAWAAEKAGWWPRGAQAGRPETPQWFKDNAVWIMSNGPWPYEQPPIPIDQAVAKIKRFADFMGDLPCAVHWYNWHATTYDNDYPHYFPTDEGFAEGVREVQAEGVRVMPYINAHIWDMDLEDFQTVARPATVKSFDGSIPKKSYRGNTFAPMCPTTPLWQKTVQDLVERLAGPEIGADGVYLDQVSAQASMECFDPSHGHPLGGGSWWPTQGYWPMIDRIRERSPGTVLTAESTAEPYVNRLDGYLTWLGYRAGDQSVPLFHAVYAGQVQLFGRLYKLDSWKGLAMRAKTAQALVWGEQLGWIIPDVIDDPVAASFLKRLARMRHELLPYLSRGQMARPPVITTDGSTLTSDWVYIEDLMVTTPTVLSGAWKHEDGKAVVILLVNIDEQPRTVGVPFSAEEHGVDGELASRMWKATEDRTAKPSWQPSSSSWSREVTLEPMSAVAIEVRAGP